MNRAVAVAVVVALSGCLHSIPLTPSEQCATQGMYLEGMAMSSGSAYATGSYGTYAVGRSYGESVSCRRPITVEERCEVAGAVAAVQVKWGWSPSGRNVLIGIGFVAYLLPGLVMLVVFDSGRNDIINDAVRAGRNARAACMASMVHIEVSRQFDAH